MHKMTKPKVKNYKNKLYVHYTLNGKRIRKALNLDDTKENRRLAELKIVPKIIEKINNDKDVNESQIPTLDDFQKISFESHKNERRVTTNKDYYNTYLKHIKPYFGDKRIDSIKVADINLWKNKLVDLGLSASRINDIKTILSTIFKDAVINEIIKNNPVPLAKPVKKTKQNDINPFTLNEVERILNSAVGQTKNFIGVSFATGMRTGEVIGLKWSDVDLMNKKIQIKRTIGRGIEGEPKTTTSEREIVLTKMALIYLQDQFELTGKENSYVFLNDKGTHFYDAKVTLRQWKKVLEDANVEYRSQYQTRHTFCSLSLQSGKKLTFVSKMMGHKNSNITLERYAKYIPSEDDEKSIFDSLV